MSDAYPQSQRLLSDGPRRHLDLFLVVSTVSHNLYLTQPCAFTKHLSRMAGAMLVLLAACRVPSLRSLIGPDVLIAGDHLKQLLQTWQRLSDSSSSPSVMQSLRIIHESDNFIKEVYAPSPKVTTSLPRRSSELK